MLKLTDGDRGLFSAIEAVVNVCDVSSPSCDKGLRRRLVGSDARVMGLSDASRLVVDEGEGGTVPDGVARGESVNRMEGTRPRAVEVSRFKGRLADELEKVLDLPPEVGAKSEGDA